ncbi:hypothetical protein VQL36_05730 [Chengkuizengella sp. SCS-71B]|uniref:hypothetical protein n=1 Tax=Chengkuizengella sp. SCS-71B TaxID=3115290 RepID=UPI0032C21B5C
MELLEFFVAGINSIGIYIIFILNTILSVYAYRDARRRGNSKQYAIIVLFGAIFFPILGLTVYLIQSRIRI